MFAFGNYDRTAEQTGIGNSGTAFLRRASQTDQDAEGTSHQQEPGFLHRWTSGHSMRNESQGATETAGLATVDRQEASFENRADLQKESGGAPHPVSSDSSEATATHHEHWTFSDGEKHDGLHNDIHPSNLREKVESDEETPSPHDVKPELHGRRDILTLARSLTKQSTWSQVPENPFDVPEDSEVNPRSENFRARAWVKSMLKLNRADENNPQRTAGVAFRNLNVHGFGNATDYQKDVGNVFFEVIGVVGKFLGLSKPRRIDILRDFEGLVRSGEMLVVLGPPGSGCTTFLRALTGETHGFTIDEGSYLNYQGIPAHRMHRDFRGEAIYTAEVDVHFPMLTVGDTLTFAARARAPRIPPGGVTRKVWADHMRDVMMATFGISHTLHTRVGNDFVRGVSGGERKRVSIAEAALSNAPLQAWDNSTRGLDSANALEFCKTLRLSSELAGCAAMVAIYQAPQAAYEKFDKAIVLYEGRQIFFGRTDEAGEYFENLGFRRRDRQTTADFLTSMTSSQERLVREGCEHTVPRTPDEFAAAWKKSATRQQLMAELDEYDSKFPFEGESYQEFAASRRAQKAKQQRARSPYTLSYFQQVELCLWRGFRRLIGDPSLTFTQLFGNVIMALVLGSVFYNLQPTTDSFFTRGAAIFFAILLNAFGSALEILTLYAQRPIVEKHSRYALYHPSAEAFASMLTDMPYKITNTITFNITFYFMVNLRREPGPFFFFVFVSFITTLTMSMLFRFIASVSKSLPQAMAPAAVFILAIVMFTGFAIPVTYMLGWCRWINYLDPVAYAFESLMINEFAGRDYSCSVYIPPTYGSLADNTKVCSSVGSVAGQAFVSGTAFIESSYAYYPDHRWRNVGIIFGFMAALMALYLVAVEYVSAAKSKGEVLIFQRGHTPASLKNKADDEETSDAGVARNAIARKESYTEATDIIQRQTAVFSWKDVCYDIKIKGEPRRILDHVDGWVKPGTLTALMGVSGAGKTTLLDVLATRVTMGVISGEMLVDGRQRDESFQRKTGYVQQQDLHLQTTTVREALNFSALLRQPKHIPRKEKLAYVEEVVKLLDMEEFVDAVVGVPGEGLNVEQRKRLTIGVELAAKPELLLFLDEPTSGLDSQTSWAICDLMEKLKNSGQAILCTIHQPSAMLFQRFDRLLFLAKGGKTVYFGDIGTNSRTLIEYFERNGSHPCDDDANPAEWMLEVIGAAPGSTTSIDWPAVWRSSPEYTSTLDHLSELKSVRPQETLPSAIPSDKNSYREFAAPLPEQLYEVTLRVFQQYWRTPSYIYSKIALCLSSSLFIGFTFYNAPLTHQGLQNQLFSIFMTFTIFGQLVQQIMPHFVTQRSLYEVRERPSKTYSWQAFIVSNVVVELPWNALMAVLMFFCYYYPVGLYHNAEPTNSVHLRGAQFFLFFLEFLLFTSSFTSMVIAGVADAETGGNIANLLFTLSLIFCGVLAPPQSLPGFWIFMYRVSPFTYLVEGFLATGIANQKTTCASNELVTFNPPAGLDCATYINPLINATGTGYLTNPSAMQGCQFCDYSDTNAFLAGVDIYYKNVWRDFGILWAYIGFNFSMALVLYWLIRVPKTKKWGLFGKRKAD